MITVHRTDSLTLIEGHLIRVSRSLLIALGGKWKRALQIETGYLPCWLESSSDHGITAILHAKELGRIKVLVSNLEYDGGGYVYFRQGAIIQI